MNRYFNLNHSRLHLKCIIKLIKERIFEHKHKDKMYCSVKFYLKGMLRSIGLIEK